MKMKPFPTCFLVFFCSWVHGAEPLVASVVSNNLAAIRRLYFPHSSTNALPFNQVKQIILDTDGLFAQSIVQLYQAERSINFLKDATKEIATWERWPTRYSNLEAANRIGDKGKLSVFFREHTNKESSLLCFGALVPARRDGYPVLPAIHVVTLSNEERAAHEILYRDDPVSEYYSPPLCLGLIERENASPCIFLARGPDGSGRFVYCYLFEATAQSWSSQRILRFSRSSDFEFVESQGVFRYTMTVGVSNQVTREIKVRE